MKNSILKIIAAITVSVFSITTVAWSASDTVYRIAVNESHGAVHQRYKGTSSKTIVHIQDAHSSLEAQRNISALISQLVSDGTTDLIGVEGAVGTVDHSEYRSFPIAEARNAVADDYMQQAQFAGCEHAHITAEEDFELYGVEHEDLFKQNFRSFYQTTLRREEILDVIQDVEDLLQDLKTPICNPDLLFFDTHAVSYERGDTDIFTFLPILFESMMTTGIDLLDFMQLEQIKDVLALEMRISFEQAREEQESLRVRIEEVDGKKDFSGCSENDISQYIKNQAIAKGFALKTYRQFVLSCEFQRKYNAVDFMRLIEEVTKAAYLVRMKLANGAEEKEIMRHCQRVNMYKKVVSLVAQRKEATFFQKNESLFDLESVCAFMRTACERYHVPFSVSNMFDSHDVTSLSKSFYTEAKSRDTAMVNNLLKRMDEHGTETAVLLSGGFHSPGIVKQLKEKGISYLTVTPAISSLAENLPYVEKMTGQLFDLSAAYTSMLVALRDSLISDVTRQSLVDRFYEDAIAKTIEYVLLDKVDSNVAFEKLSDSFRQSEGSEIQSLVNNFNALVTAFQEKTGVVLTREAVLSELAQQLTAQEAVEEHAQMDHAYQELYDNLVELFVEFYDADDSEVTATEAIPVTYAEDMLEAQVESDVDSSGQSVWSRFVSVVMNSFVGKFIVAVVLFTTISFNLTFGQGGAFTPHFAEQGEVSEYAMTVNRSELGSFAQTGKRMYIMNENIRTLQEGVLVVNDGWAMTRPGEGRSSLLVTVNVADCVGLILYDKTTQTGALAHITNESKEFGFKGLTEALNTIVAHMRAEGVSVGNLSGLMVGGQSGLSEELIAFIENYLKGQGITIQGQDLGGNGTLDYAFNTETGELYFFEHDVDGISEKLGDIEWGDPGDLPSEMSGRVQERYEKTAKEKRHVLMQEKQYVYGNKGEKTKKGLGTDLTSRIMQEAENVGDENMNEKAVEQALADGETYEIGFVQEGDGFVVDAPKDIPTKFLDAIDATFTASLRAQLAERNVKVMLLKGVDGIFSDAWSMGHAYKDTHIVLSHTVLENALDYEEAGFTGVDAMRLVVQHEMADMVRGYHVNDIGVSMGMHAEMGVYTNGMGAFRAGERFVTDSDGVMSPMIGVAGDFERLKTFWVTNMSMEHISMQKKFVSEYDELLLKVSNESFDGQVTLVVNQAEYTGSFIEKISDAVAKFSQHVEVVTLNDLAYADAVTAMQRAGTEAQEYRQTFFMTQASSIDADSTGVQYIKLNQQEESDVVPFMSMLLVLLDGVAEGKDINRVAAENGFLQFENGVLSIQKSVARTALAHSLLEQAAKKKLVSMSA